MKKGHRKLKRLKVKRKDWSII